MKKLVVLTAFLSFLGSIGSQAALIGTYVVPDRETFFEKATYGPLAQPDLAWVGLPRSVNVSSGSSGRHAKERDFDIELTIQNQAGSFTIQQNTVAGNVMYTLCIDKKYVLGKPERWGPNHSGRALQSSDGQGYCYTLIYTTR